MRLEDLHPTKGSIHRKKRIARGYGSGRGGHASGRGTKGQNSRSGGGTRIGYEGGQTPVWMRFPKRGFRNYTRVEYSCVNLDTLEEKFPAEAEVSLDILRKKRLIKGKTRRLKVLGRGELTKPLRVKAHRFTGPARERIEQVGGRAEVVK